MSEQSNAMGDELADSIVGRPRKGLLEMIDNGIGLRVSRLMIVVGFPCVTVLAGYAFNVTMARLADQMAVLNNTLSSLNATVEKQNDKLIQAQIDIARLQAERERR